MATNQCHNTPVIKVLCVGFDICSLSGNVTTLTLINGFIRHDNRASLSFGSSGSNPSANLIDKFLGEEVQGVVELRTISSNGQMSLTEISIRADDEVGPSKICNLASMQSFERRMGDLLVTRTS